MNPSIIWHNSLPKYFQIENEDTALELKKLKVEYYFPDESFAMMIMITPWAVRRLQWFMYYTYKRQYEYLNEKELWKYVILSRMNVKESINYHPDPNVYPISKDKINYIKDNIDSIISKFRNFDDLVEYLVKIDLEEGQFNDPGGLNQRINKILMKNEANFKDYSYFDNHQS